MMWEKAGIRFSVSDTAFVDMSIIHLTPIVCYLPTLVIKTPENLVELSTIRDDESLGVPRPETMNTIFFLDGSQSCSHFGKRTAISGKKAASMTHPCVEDEELFGVPVVDDSNAWSPPRNRNIDRSSTGTGVFRISNPTGTTKLDGSGRTGYCPCVPSFWRE